MSEARDAFPAVVVDLRGVGLWLPRVPSYAAWAAGERCEEPVRPGGGGLARTAKRRAGPLGRALADAAGEAMRTAGVEPSRTPLVVGSSIGEAATMIGLLEQMWRTEEPLSPAAFSLSVHNAAAGVMSIGYDNRGFATSMAADADTPAMGLLEAAGLALADKTPVVLACADEEAPRALVVPGHEWDMLAAAVVVAPPQDDESALARLELHPVAGLAAQLDDAERLAFAAVSAELGRNPQVGLVDLIDAVCRGASGWLPLDRGSGRGFVVRLGPQPPGGSRR